MQIKEAGIEKWEQAVLPNFFSSHIPTQSKQKVLTKSTTNLSCTPLLGRPHELGGTYMQGLPYLTNQFLAPRTGKNKQQNSLIIIDGTLFFIL